MSVHTRRAALAVLATAAAATPLLIATRSALAQTAPAAPTDPQAYTDYVTQTLAIGGMSLAASQIAVKQAQDAMVKEFAQLEVGEQTAVATVLSATGAQPAALDADSQAKVTALQGMTGADFDKAYIQAQIDGHQQLLKVQQTISAGMDATVEVITAKLAEQGIMSHLAMLAHIQQQVGKATATTETPATETPTTTTTTTETPAAPTTTTTTTDTSGAATPAPATPTTTTTTTTTTAAPATPATTTTTAAPAATPATTTTTAAPAAMPATTTTTAQ